MAAIEVGLIYGEQNGEKQYYLTNAHGDVDMLADGAGNVIKTYTYDAFGVETKMKQTQIRSAMQGNIMMGRRIAYI